MKAQDAASQQGDRPLPDVAALILSVEANQRTAESVRKDYLYHSVQTEQEMDGSGKVKKTTSQRI